MLAGTPMELPAPGTWSSPGEFQLSGLLQEVSAPPPPSQHSVAAGQLAPCVRRKFNPPCTIAPLMLGGRSKDPKLPLIPRSARTMSKSTDPEGV